MTTHTWVKGQSASMAIAQAAAVKLLQEACSPGILGLNLVTIETCEATVKLARCCNAWLSPWPPDPIRFWGQQSPDLARSRREWESDADLVLYLGFSQGVDAVQPRHRERHLSRGPGLDRRQLQVDWQPEARLQNIIALRLHAERGEPLPPPLYELIQAITAAQSVQVFFLAQLTQEDPAYVEQWQQFAARQRQHRRVGVSLLGSTGKARTVTEALTWMTGYPGPLHFVQGQPHYLPQVGEAEALLRRQTLDVIVWLGMNPLDQKEESAGLNSHIKHIVLSTDPPKSADVAFTMPGLDPQLDAHIIRGDGIMLRLAGSNPGTPDPMAQCVDTLAEGLA